MMPAERLSLDANQKKAIYEGKEKFDIFNTLKHKKAYFLSSNTN